MLIALVGTRRYVNRIGVSVMLIALVELGVMLIALVELGVMLIALV